MSPFYYFIQSIPESIGLVALSLAFARVSLRWGRILIGGVLISIVSYIIRSLPFTFGFHLPVMIFVLFLYMIKLTNVKSSRAVMVIFGSFLTLMSLEYVVTNVFLAISQMDLNEALDHQAMWAALGIFQTAILNGIALVVSRYLKPVQELWKK